MSFLSENSALVWKGCGLSLVEIIENCISDKLNFVYNNKLLGLFLIEPLLQLTQSGVDPIKQEGSIFCILYILEHFIQNEYFDLLD